MNYIPSVWTLKCVAKIDWKYESYFDEIRGETFSPRYGSSFWFDPLFPQKQLIVLSLNGLYLFSPRNSSFRMVRTYSPPEPHIQLI